LAGDGYILLAGVLLVVGLAATALAGRLRLPGLVVLLAVGMLAGSQGIGGISFSDYQAAQVAGIIALSLILFEGGLAAGWPAIRPVALPAISLATVGTLLTAAVAGFASVWIFDLSLLEGLLVGAIISATDSAAIFAVLRDSTLRTRLTRTLEGESGFNDPVAILLVIGFIEWIQVPNYGIVDMAWLFVLEIGVGLAVGLLVGRLALTAFQRAKLPSAGLYPVASLAAAAVAFGLAAVLHGSGFLAVYVAALIIGGRPSPALRTITTFHDGLAWLAQLGMFLMLGLLVFPGQLVDIAPKAALLALALMFVARPLATLVATIGARFSVAERITLGWAGLRGAAPIVLATFPVIDSVGQGFEFFNIVFFVVLLSTIVQGATINPLARLLGVTTSSRAHPAPLIDTPAMSRLGAEIVDYEVSPSDAAVGHRVRELGLPRDALLNLIVRGDRVVPPRGSTRIEARDRLHVLLRQETALDFEAVIERWKNGPLDTPVPSRVSPRGFTIFSSRPWSDEDGDPGRPSEVNGVAVIDQLRTRRDIPGAVVALEDGRFAYTGPIVAIGSAAQVRDSAERRLRKAGDDSEAAWWREVIGALAVQ
jgi:cell volume regulation protein A